MRVLELALAGVLAITTPIVAHANERGSNMRPVWRRQEGGMTVHHAASNAHHEASDPRACTEADRVIAAFVFAKVATEDRSDGLALS